MYKNTISLLVVPKLILIGCLLSFLNWNQQLLMAVPIGVIDGGVDVSNAALSKNFLSATDSVNGIDDDLNGYIDDSFGWNFAENTYNQITSEIIPTNYSKAITLSNLLTKYEAGVPLKPSEEPKVWQFLLGNNLSISPNLLSYVGEISHGTHVSGIIIKTSEKSAQICSLQITRNPAFTDLWSIRLRAIHHQLLQRKLLSSNQGIRFTTTDSDIIELLVQQDIENPVFRVSVEQFSQYIKDKQLVVANMSMGISFLQISEFIKSLCLNEQINCPTSRIERLTTLYFERSLNPIAEKLLQYNKKVLFVVAAGNDSVNIDTQPFFPARTTSINQLIVASTNYTVTKLADFSNFGDKQVDVAAPGEYIRSDFPQNKKGYMSGTSMAAPYVTGVVSLMLKFNPRLSAEEIRQMILETVDQKEWLIGKVASAGVINKKRAVYAAKKSTKMSLDEAIKQAKLNIADFNWKTTK